MIRLCVFLALVFVSNVALADFKHVVGHYGTEFKYKGENSARAANIALAASRVNQVVLQPGETLSFNTLVGPRTTKAGFKKAHVIVKSKLVDGIGGGACQVASTLHAAALYAGLDIVEAHAHSLASAYIQPGLDATVSYPNLDLKIRNVLPFPVKIVAEVVVPGILSVDLMADYDNPLVVRVDFKTKLRTRRAVVVVKSSELKRGSKLLQAGNDGLNVKRSVTITRKLTGELVYEEVQFFDFVPLEKIIVVPDVFIMKDEEVKTT